MILVINCGTSSIKMTLFGKKRVDGVFRNLFSSPSLEIAGKKNRNRGALLVYRSDQNHDRSF